MPRRCRFLAWLPFVLALARPARAAESSTPPAASGPADRLPWVNPARCLPACAADPSTPLRRLDDQGRPSPRGKHRVEAAAADALVSLLSAARDAGFKLKVNSSFRSYREQARVFRTTKERGRAARPGHSEHQLGTAIDLRLPSDAAIAWLSEHAFEHGFAHSYPPGKQRLTGYRPEPWHIRFVGLAVARALHERGLTLEELFRAEPGLGASGACGDCPAKASRAPCGRVEEDGSCQGTVLTWCYDGALAAVDCAVSHQTCSAEGGARPDCR